MNRTIQKGLKTICLFSFFFSLSSAFAQAPQAMSYQAVIRNAGNTLVADANVGMRISVLQGTANGTAVYVETQNAMTSANGLVTLEIGTGAVVSGTFASISWGTNAYFIKTETDPTGGTNYTIVGTSQFLSVPYALFAANSGASSSSISGTTNKIIKFSTPTTGVDSQISDDGTYIKIKPIGYTGFDPSLSKMQIAGNNNTLRLIGTGATYGEFAKLNFGDADRVFITEDADDKLQINSSSRIAITGGNVGIGTLTPVERLDVNGKTKTTDLQVVNGAGVGKVLTSDAIGNATWQGSATVNQTYQTSVYNLTTPLQDSEVDFPTTNVTAPSAGTYLITYFVDAYNSFTNTCINNCGTPPLVYYTNAYLYNKSNNGRYQAQRVDFSLQDHTGNAASTTTFTQLPAHQISGSTVQFLNANDAIGIKMRSVADAGAVAEIRIRESTITLVRLY